MIRMIKGSDLIRAVFGLLIVIGFFVFLALFLFRPPESEYAATILTSMISILGALVGAVGFYYFGSSSGSKEKQDTIERIAKNGHS